MTKKGDRSNPYRRRNRPKKEKNSSTNIVFSNDSVTSPAHPAQINPVVALPSKLSQVLSDSSTNPFVASPKYASAPTHSRHTQRSTKALNEYYYQYSRANDHLNPATHMYYDHERINLLIEQEEIIREEI